MRAILLNHEDGEVLYDSESIDVYSALLFDEKGSFN